MAMAAICPRNLLPDRIPPLCYTTYNLNVTGGGGHILQADNKPTNQRSPLVHEPHERRTMQCDDDRRAGLMNEKQSKVR